MGSRLSGSVMRAWATIPAVSAKRMMRCRSKNRAMYSGFSFRTRIESSSDSTSVTLVSPVDQAASQTVPTGQS